MDVEFILKIAGMGILVTICTQVLSKAGREDQASFVAIGGVIVALIMLVNGFSELVDLVRGIFSI